MPNIAYKPRPMVDPYAGRAGELLNQLFSTISQIHQLRQQRNQTNAVLEIVQNPKLTDEQKRMKIFEVARNGGDVLRNMIARQYLSDALMPPLERQYKQAQIQSMQNLADWRKSQAQNNNGPLTDITKVNAAIKSWQSIYENAEAGSPEEQDALNNINALKEQIRVVPKKRDLPLGVSNQINNVDQPAIGTMPFQFPNMVNQNKIPANQMTKSMSFNMPNISTGGMSGLEIATSEVPTRPLPPGIVTGINEPALGINNLNQPLQNSVFQEKTPTNSPAGLQEIWDELDDESKRGAMSLLAEGEDPKNIIAFYKKKKGK